MMTARVLKAKEYAIFHHNRVNHLYDGKPYSTHLQMVYEFGVKYSYLLPPELIEDALCGCWKHDLIEDTGLTYNDIKKAFDEFMANVVYALSNEKGKTRKERANSKYYKGIRKILIAVFIKICDRLANMKYSKENKSSMFGKYVEENKNFKKQLTKKNLINRIIDYIFSVPPLFEPMFKELEEMAKK